MIGIYKITSPTNKVYIGQSVDIEHRWSKHKYNNIKTKLCNSFKKHGFNNHVFEVVEECDVNVLNDRERHYQEFYSVVGKNGLNLKLTNSKDKSGNLHEDVKLKISNRTRTFEEIEKSRISRTGLKRTTEQKKRIKDSRTYFNMSQDIKDKISISNKGKYPSLESRFKMSKAKTKRSIKIILDQYTGVFYLGSKEASLSVGYSECHINKMLTGKRTNKTNLIHV